MGLSHFLFVGERMKINLEDEKVDQKEFAFELRELFHGLQEGSNTWELGWNRIKFPDKT